MGSEYPSGAMRARRAVLALLLAVVALVPISGGAAGPAWEQWKSVPGVFDVGGPRSDGSVLVAGTAALYTLTSSGDLVPFARGPGGYRDDRGMEAYLAVAPGQHVASTGCDFNRDDTFLLRQHDPIGITRINQAGDETGSFVNVGLPSLTGLAFDTEGSFEHRLLVAGPLDGKTEIVAIDCAGVGKYVTRTAPPLEGGFAVAPMSFGAFGGWLIAPDENTGVIWGIGADGTAKPVAASGLPTGRGVGVESIGFVPPGFARGGQAYYADRKTAGSQQPGSDSVLRIASAALVAAGVQDGDMLAVTEGGASMIDVRCDTNCHVSPVLGATAAAHGSGHLVFTLNTSASQGPSARPTGPPTQPAANAAPGAVPLPIVIVIALLAAAAGAAVAVALARRR